MNSMLSAVGFRRFALALALTLLVGNAAWAQLVAFPGAEGAGRLATGGRGGDVYHVINLNDSGAGSLRFGIANAPVSGRTIVFDVAGTIPLASSLDFNGKSNITIAGQTAPAGGITIANHRMRINNSNNLIIQYLRVRPGNTFGNQDPDAIWIPTSTNVILDHITASWGVDETISVTNNSNNVTVQWSTLSQGLYDGGHSEGPGHSYGSLLNGGAYTYHHNLYAHNKGRHPRAQALGNYLRLDFVNNTVYNPGDYLGLSDNNDPFDVNLIGNYGLIGPRADEDEDYYFYLPADDASIFYTEGNVMDNIRDGLVNGVGVDEAAMFSPGSVYTLSPTRLSAAQLPALSSLQSAEDAYIQTLSRAGSINYRDSVDRRMIRSVINQTELSINNQTEMGGWPALPTGSPAPDSNGDGVPNDWALENYGDITTPLNTTPHASGYTYLETYIHSLTPHAYIPTNTVEHTIRTSYGAGADAQLNENGGTSSGDGAAGSLNAIYSGASGSTNQMIALRFDLAQLEAGSVVDARLELTASDDIVGQHQFKVYGLEHDADSFDWNEGTIDFAGMDGVVFDGNSGTLGIDPTYNQTDPIDVPDLLRLGEFTIDGAASGETITFEAANLEVFLNLAAYFADGPEDGLVTLLLEQINDTVADDASFYSKEGGAQFAPRLVVDAVLEPYEDADFNNDDIVDGNDFLIWQLGFNGAGTLEDGDANGDGLVNDLDLVIWENQYGTPGGLAAAAAVPEPAGCLLMAFGMLGALVQRRRAKEIQARLGEMRFP